MDSVRFDDVGLSVDRELVTGPSGSIKLAEIRTVILKRYRTDGHVLPIVGIGSAILFLIWIAAPIQNSGVGLVLLGLATFGLYKHENRAPVRHEVWVNTGGSLNKRLLVTTDEDTAASLRDALETSMRGGR